MKERTLRRAQLISPFGVGALVDISGESFLIKSIDKWIPAPRKSVDLDRLSLKLAGKKLRCFEDVASRGKEQFLRVERFPRWYHCSRCKNLRFITREEDESSGGATPQCRRKGCRNHEMSPMRFVAYCDGGHMSDINWFTWCHRGGDASRGYCKDTTQLYFKASGRMGGDFQAMEIECKACGRTEDLTDISRGTVAPWMLQDRPEAKDAKCCGKQPWQKRSEQTDCAQEMKVEPRGSSSIYRARVLSALDLGLSGDDFGQANSYPVLDEYLDNLLDGFPSRQFALATIKSSDFRGRVRIQRMSHDLGISEVDAMEYLSSKLEEEELPDISLNQNAAEDDADLQKELLIDELKIFRNTGDINEQHLVVNFFTLSDLVDSLAASLFARVGQVKKLREVRAITGFSRGTGRAVLEVDLGRKLDWIPAIDAFGEGIYLELNSSTISKYLLEHAADIERVVSTQQTAVKKMEGSSPLEIPSSPLFLMIHTLSHLLIRQLTFNSGYSSSSLRERIYVDDAENYAAILIYTTDTDPDGTLGGLVDQGRKEVIEALVNQIKESAIWCSADPVCRETEAQGFMNLNHSACHCCSLVAETSCGYHNTMLNRMLLGGMGRARDEVLGLMEFVSRL